MKMNKANVLNKKWQNILNRIEDPDPIVATTIRRMQSRSAEGIKKYGVTMMREDVTTVEWIDHAIEEALDMAIYLERVKRDLMNG
jgi:hypothetical protein|tara:strand:- start:36 stop:290 length:255 start_codon:yes stop_codon:yes gene_type:complete